MKWKLSNISLGISGRWKNTSEDNPEGKEQAAAIIIQRCVRGTISRNRFRVEQGRNLAKQKTSELSNNEDLPNVLEIFDSNLQIPYYYLTDTDSIVWKAPEKFIPAFEHTPREIETKAGALEYSTPAGEDISGPADTTPREINEKARPSTPQALDFGRTNVDGNEKPAADSIGAQDDALGLSLGGLGEPGEVSMSTFQAPLSSPTRMSVKQEANGGWSEAGDFFSEDLQDVSLFNNNVTLGSHYSGSARGSNTSARSSASTRSSNSESSAGSDTTAKSEESNASSSPIGGVAGNPMNISGAGPSPIHPERSMASMNDDGLQREIEYSNIEGMSRASKSRLGDFEKDAVHRDFSVAESVGAASTPRSSAMGQNNGEKAYYQDVAAPLESQGDVPHGATAQHAVVSNVGVTHMPPIRVVVEFHDSSANVPGVIVNLGEISTLETLMQECQRRLDLKSVHHLELKGFKARVEQVQDLRNDDVLVLFGEAPDPALEALRESPQEMFPEEFEEQGGEDSVEIGGCSDVDSDGKGDQKLADEDSGSEDQVSTSRNENEDVVSVAEPSWSPLPKYRAIKLEVLLEKFVENTLKEPCELGSPKPQSEPQSHLEAQQGKCFNPEEAIQLLGSLIPAADAPVHSYNGDLQFSAFIKCMERIGSRMPMAQQRVVFDIIDQNDEDAVDTRSFQLFLHVWQRKFQEQRKKLLQNQLKKPVQKGLAAAANHRTGARNARDSPAGKVLLRSAKRVHQEHNAPYCSATSSTSHLLFRKRNPKRTMERLMKARMLANRFTNEFKKAHLRGPQGCHRHLEEMFGIETPSRSDQAFNNGGFWVSPKLSYYQREEKLRRALLGARGLEKAEILYCFADCLVEEARKRRGSENHDGGADSLENMGETVKRASMRKESGRWQSELSDNETGLHESNFLFQRAQGMLEQALRVMHKVVHAAIEGETDQLERCKRDVTLEQLKSKVSAMLGTVHSELGAPEKANKYFGQSLMNKDSKCATVHFRKADHILKSLTTLRQSKDNTKTINRILRSVEHTHHGSPSEILVKLEMEAKSHLLAAISCEPNHFPSLLALGRLLQFAGDLTNSEVYFRRATGISNWPALYCRPKSAPLQGTPEGGRRGAGLARTTGGASKTPSRAKRTEPLQFVQERATAMRDLALLVSDVRSDHDLAISLLRKSSRLVPRQAETMFHLGRLLCVHKRNNYGAEKWFRRVIDCDPDHHDAILALAQILAQEDLKASAEAPGKPALTGRVLEAERLYKRAIDILSCSIPPEQERSPLRADKLAKLQTALHSFAQYWEVVHHDQEQACHYYELAHHMNPDSAAAACAFGNFLRDKGDLAKAAPLFRKVARKEPKDAASRFALAQTLLAEGKRDRAVEYLHEVVRLSPCHGEALWALARLERSAGNEGRAEALYERASACAVPEPADLLADFGAFLYSSARAEGGRWGAGLDAAVARLKAALRLDPGHVLALSTLGWVTYEVGEDVKGAVTLLRRAVARSTDAEALKRLGTLLSLGAVQGARFVPGVVAGIDGDESLTDGSQSDLSSEREVLSLEEAAECLEAALVQRPDDVECLLRCALVLTATVASALDRRGGHSGPLGRLKKATRLLRRALQQEPENAELHYHLGVVCHKVAVGTGAGGRVMRGDATRYLRMAVDSLKRAIKLSPCHVLAMFHLAMQAEHVDQLQISEKLLLAGLDVDPRATPHSGDFGAFLFMVRRAYHAAERAFLRGTGSASGSKEAPARQLILHQRVQKFASLKAVEAKRILASVAEPKRSRKLLPTQPALSDAQQCANEYLEAFRLAHPARDGSMANFTPVSLGDSYGESKGNRYNRMKSVS